MYFHRELGTRYAFSLVAVASPRGRWISADQLTGRLALACNVDLRASPPELAKSRSDWLQKFVVDADKEAVMPVSLRGIGSSKELRQGATPVNVHNFKFLGALPDAAIAALCLASTAGPMGVTTTGGGRQHSNPADSPPPWRAAIGDSRQGCSPAAIRGAVIASVSTMSSFCMP